MTELFSPLENKVLIALGKRTLSIWDLTCKIYGGEPHEINQTNVIAGTVRRINKKCEHHKLDWFLNGVGAGRGGKIVWKDKAPKWK